MRAHRDVLAGVFRKQGAQTRPKGRHPRFDLVAGEGLVEAAAAVGFAAGALCLALDRGRLLALANLRGLLVELAPPHIGQYPGLFAGALEAAQRRVKNLVLFYPYGRQVSIPIARTANFSDSPPPLQLLDVLLAASQIDQA